MISSSTSTSKSPRIYHEDLVRSLIPIPKVAEKEQHFESRRMEEVGVVLRTYQEQQDQDSDSDDDDDDEEDPELSKAKNDPNSLARPLKPGEITVGFYPSCVKAIVNEDEVQVLDR